MKNCITILMFLSFTFVPNANAQLFKDIKKNIKKAGQKIDNALSKQKKVNKTKEVTSVQRPTRQETQEESIQFEKGISFDAPNDNFFSFELQSFRGAPRFGRLNGYGSYNPNVRGGSSTRDNQQVRAEMKNLGYAYAKYNLLLKAKYLAPFFNVMDKEMPYAIKHYQMSSKRYEDENEAYSMVAQTQLQNMAYVLLKERAFKNYFCAPDSDCKIALLKNRYVLETSKWYGEDEFETIETYKDFIAENYTDLMNWSAQIKDEGYLVEKISFKQYNFEKGGFYLRFYPGTSINKFQTEGKVIYNIRNQKRLDFTHLFKMNTSDAKALIERKDEGKLGRHLYAVYKVKFYGIGSTYKSLSISTVHRLSLLNHITTPVIELFEDEALTKKLGEIPIDQGQ